MSIKLFGFLTKTLATLTIAGSVFILGGAISTFFQFDAHWQYSGYNKVYMKFDTLQNFGTRYLSYAGLKLSNPNFEAVSFTHDQKYAYKMDSIFLANEKKLWVFFKDYESPAYFVEDEFQEMSFKSIWLPVLRNLGIFILIVLNFFFWRHKYHQAILATGMSLDEYSRLQESKRPKRKSLSEEYEEIMKRENEKKNQP